MGSKWVDNPNFTPEQQRLEREKWARLDPTNLPGGRSPFSASPSPRTLLPDEQNRTGGDYGIYTPDIATDPNYQRNRAMVRGELGRVNAMPVRQMDASTANGVDPNQAFRDQQLQLGNALMAQANGQGPSVAGSQLQQSTDMNLQAALAQAASSRGGNLGAAQYQLGNARANIQQQAAQGLAQTRIQEQMAARSQLGQVLDQGRGADITTAGMAQQNNQFNAGQMQSAAGSNLSAGVLQDSNKADQIQKLIAMGYTMDQANVMLGVQQGQFNSQQLNTGEAARHGVAIQQGNQTMQTLGAVGAAAGTVLMAASDERLKTNIVDGDDHAKHFLDALVAKHYSYKDEKWGEGPRMGIMAQDAERSALGRSFVVDTKDGKMLDLNKAVSAALASMAYLNKRVNKLER